MRPNLSVEKIAGALAVLGTSVVLTALSACGDSKPANTPVNSTDTSATPAAGGDKPADGHCGASATHKPGEASCGAAKGGDTKPADTSTPTTASTPSTPATPDTSKPSASASAPAGSAKPDTKKPGAAPAGGKKGGGASCGAGTCSAKK